MGSGTRELGSRIRGFRIMSLYGTGSVCVTLRAASEIEMGLGRRSSPAPARFRLRFGIALCVGSEG